MKEKEIREMTLEEIRKTFCLEKLNETEFKKIVMCIAINDVFARHGLGDLTPDKIDTVDFETKKKINKEVDEEWRYVKEKFGWA